MSQPAATSANLLTVLKHRRLLLFLEQQGQLMPDFQSSVSIPEAVAVAVAVNSVAVSAPCTDHGYVTMEIILRFSAVN